MAVRQADEYDRAPEVNGGGRARFMYAAEREYRKAEVHAAVAQAEALDRISNILERIVSWDADQASGNLRVDMGVS